MDMAPAVFFPSVIPAQEPSSGLSANFSHPASLRYAGREKAIIPNNFAFSRALAWEKVPKGDEGLFKHRFTFQ